MYVVIQSEGVALRIRRSFGGRKMEEWSNLKKLLEHCELRDCQDEGHELLAQFDRFTSNSLYEEILNSGVMHRLRKANLTLKFKIFVRICMR